ncbi:MAG: Asp-tRNA(Asn)/Glu-tRNA(Gln) amidotransferase subunit GatA [Kiritimatiellae bacterium]|nr:Asp-tRNA(Asn)/Glu-tRNA(Gln) amidotransferase subunit GatA [Kiritimatiellia bacterium]
MNTPSPHTDLMDLTVADLRSGLQSGAFQSVDLARALMEAVDRGNPALGAYLGLDAEEIMAAARHADEARAAGDRRTMLGIPVGLKDNLNVRGWPCTCGSRMLESYRAMYDATAVARLRAAGMIPAGRMNMDEFAMGSTTETSAYARTRNPWNAAHVPGGSSGGSAAAVAGRIAWAALGSDTGGSIRQPASFCGCVGLKPTYGRVSRYGLVAFASSLDQIGPLTRTVRDAALLLGALAGPDPMDATCLDEPIPDYETALNGDIRGMKIGLPREYSTGGCSPAVERATADAIERLCDLGAEVVEISLPHTEHSVAAYYIIATAEASANLARFDGMRYGKRVEGADPIEQYGRTRAAGFGAEVKRRIILGTYVLSSGYHDAYYLQAQKVRTLIRRDFEAAFQRCDLIAAPVAPTPAFPSGACAGDPLQLYLSDIFTIPVNLAGLCGLSLPCRLSPEGLPIGLQLIGRPFDEARLLRAGHALETALGDVLPRPPRGTPA